MHESHLRQLIFPWKKSVVLGVVVFCCVVLALFVVSFDHVTFLKTMHVHVHTHVHVLYIQMYMCMCVPYMLCDMLCVVSQCGGSSAVRGGE